jgi:hypothetical protein
MQKVLDKLKNISEDNTKNNEKSSEILARRHKNICDGFEKVAKSLILAHKSIEHSENKIIDTIEKNKTTPNVNNYTEYSLLGSKSQFRPLTLIIMLFSIIVIWCSAKYLPAYFTENSLLNKEKEEYELFYEYVSLKQFKEGEINIADEILKKIKQKDSLFIKEYRTLSNTYKREIRKQELKEELNSLDNNDR